MCSLSELKIEVENKVRHCIDTANQRFPTYNFKMPRIKYDLRGTTAGKAFQNGYYIDINSVLLIENQDETVNNTVPHEVAHLIDAIVNPHTRQTTITYTRTGRRRRANRSIHGPTWKKIMHLFGVDPERTHDMDVSNARVKTRNRYDYRCPTCSTVVTAGPKHHKKLQRGHRMQIKSCKHFISGPNYLKHRVL